jgi:hypothetical protein
MEAFVSYSVEDKVMGGAVKTALEGHGFHSFLAHEDLQVSEEWKERLLEELKQVNVFVALLSKSFAASKWCAQEIGFIVSRPDVLIIPLSLDGTTPYGFISHLQGILVRDEFNVGAVLEEVLFRRRPRLMIPKQIEKVLRARSYRGAEALVRPLVPHFAKFSVEEEEAFAMAAASNHEVWDAGACREEYIPEFVRVCRTRLSAARAAQLKEVIEDLDFTA